LLEAHLERIERRNRAVGAVVSVEAAAARAAARAADDALERGQVTGPLHGIPVLLKDGHEVAGLRSTVGARELDHVADADGTVAARLRAAGAILFGHTNAAAWLADLQTSNPIFGRTSNPWDSTRTAGGSSGGAAAAVAASLTPFDVGSDLTGSVRLPASFCGVYGLKTTEHRVPLTGFFRTPGDGPRPVRILSCLGPIARSVDDLALVLGVISGPDGLDGDVPPVPLPPSAPRSLGELRLAIAPTMAGAPVAASVRRRVTRLAAEAMEAGARIETRLPALDWAELGALFTDLVETVTGVLAPGKDEDDERFSLAWYLEALGRRDRLVSVWERYFDDLDALVVPASMTAAFRHCEPGGAVPVDGRPVSYYENGRLLGPANLVGAPALTVPAGLDDEGLPIGVQIVGPRWSEMRLLDVARALEDAGALPGFQPPPGD
jgi:amidase